MGIADFAADDYEHVVIWDETNEWIKMRLRSTHEQRIRIGNLDLEVSFAAGEDLRPEVSAKCRPDNVRAELATAGLRPFGSGPTGKTSSA